MVREIRDDVSPPDLHQPVLHELGLDIEVIVDRLEFRHKSAADEAVKIRARDKSHV